MKNKNKKTKIVNTNGVRGELRKLHFSSGGSAKEWTGIHVIQKNKKDKRKNRSTEKKEKINQSQE